MTRGKLIVSTSSEDLWLENITELGWQVYLCSTPPFLMQTKLDQRMNEYTRLAMAGDVAKARVVRDSLNPVREALKNTRPPDKPQAQQKYWADLLGQVGGLVRRPLLNLTDEEKVIVKTAFDTCGLQV
jgi:4-hydroxy-tetrahydrodipicolinate synthase